MPPKKDLHGYKVHDLEVIGRAPSRFTSGGNSKARWTCRCDCGSVKDYDASVLINGTTKSCGCKKRFNMKGRVFGSLTVIDEITGDEYSPLVRHWSCLCECGEEIITITSNLTRGRVVSCGCHRDSKMINPVIPMVGKRYGKLLVRGVVGVEICRRGSRAVMIDCLCDCGRGTKVIANEVRSGSVSSCGCVNRPNLSGKRFGRLTVISEDVPRTFSNGKSRRHWLCECDCGETSIANTTNLICGNVSSCGCLQRDRASQAGIKRAKDLSGKSFGKLVVVRKAAHKRGKEYPWECKCECGNVAYVHAIHLEAGNTTSCGCKRRLRGPEHFNYDHSISIEERAYKRRNLSPGYSGWVTDVYKKASYRCEVCGSNLSLCAHHIRSFARFHDLRVDLNNGACLCGECHGEFHDKYGMKKFTHNDFYVFRAQKAFELARLEDECLETWEIN